MAAEQGWEERADPCRPTTLLIMPVSSDGTIAVQTHPLGTEAEGRRFFFGGEVFLEDEFCSILPDDPTDIGSRVLLSAAMLKVNGDLWMLDDRGVPERLNPENARAYLFPVPGIDSLTWKRAPRTILYLLRIPGGSSILPMAAVRGSLRALEIQFHPLDTILQRYNDQTWQFAAGSEWVLGR